MNTPGGWAGTHFGWLSGSVHGSVLECPGFGGARSKPLT